MGADRRRYCRGKTIAELNVVHDNRLFKDIFSRSPNRMLITTMGNNGILLEPMRDMFQRKYFDLSNAGGVQE